MKKLSEFKCPPVKKKTGEKYCRLCEKREKRGTCGYGGKIWDRYTVDDVSQEEKTQRMDEYQGSNSDANEEVMQVIDLSDNLSEIIETDPLIQNPTSNYRYDEAAPPGREKQVKKLKKKVGKDKAYAFSWAQHNKKK